MNTIKQALECLVNLLKTGRLKKLVVTTKNGTETFTSSKATTLDRLVPEVSEEALILLATYLCTKWNTEAAVVEVDFTRSMGDLPFYVVWREGIWYDGVWVGGEWHGGVWKHGVWLNGLWYDGVWENGVWEGGVWYGGQWLGGVWKGGVFHPKNRFERDRLKP